MPVRIRTQALATAGREVAAYAKQALLLRHDTDAPVLPRGVRDGDDVVVLLHGLFATAGVLRPLRAAIARLSRRAPIHTAAVSYPSTSGVAVAAERLAEALRELPAGARLHLCGHSLGGLVCRLYALEAGDRRVVQTISLATPFGGVPGVGRLGFACARDLEPQSQVLRRVLLGGCSSVPHLSIIAGADGIVRSPISHALPGGEVKVMEGLGHSALLFDREVAEIIAQRVLRASADALGRRADVAEEQPAAAE